MTGDLTWSDQLQALTGVVDELLAIWRPDGPTDAEVQDMNKLALSILACGYLCHVYTDDRRPVFMPLWNYACNQGGPNPDYVYLNAQVDPNGVYEISGFRGTLSLRRDHAAGARDDRHGNIHPGPDRFAAAAHERSRRAQHRRDGSFRVILSAERPAGHAG